MSRFFSLQPSGLGTIEGESLASFIRRLAAAHVVSPSTLLRDSVLKPVRAARGQRYLIFEPSRLGESINSGCSAASKLIVQAVGAMTGVELAGTTFATLTGSIAFGAAFRTERAWCSLCIASENPYDRLVWSLRAWRVCRTHAVPLDQNCPECGRSHRPLHPFASPSLCPWCGHRLASACRSGAAIPEDQRALQTIVTLALRGGLDRSQVGDLISAAVHDHGGLRALSRCSGVSAAELSALVSGRVRPSLKTLTLCQLALTHEPGRHRSPRSGLPTGSRRQLRPGDDSLRFVLESALNRADQGDPPSLREFARLHHVTPAYVRLRLPDLAHALVEGRRQALHAGRLRREAAVRARVAGALERLRRLGLGYSRRALEREVGQSGLLRVPYIRSVASRPLRSPEVPRTQIWCRFSVEDGRKKLQPVRRNG